MTSFPGEDLPAQLYPDSRVLSDGAHHTVSFRTNLMLSYILPNSSRDCCRAIRYSTPDQAKTFYSLCGWSHDREMCDANQLLVVVIVAAVASNMREGRNSNSSVNSIGSASSAPDGAAPPQDHGSFTPESSGIATRSSQRPGIKFEQAILADKNPVRNASFIGEMGELVMGLLGYGSGVWIGKTSGPLGMRKRWNAKYQGMGYTHMCRIYQGASEKMAYEVERKLINHVGLCNLKNETGGSGGGRGRCGPYIVYAVW